MGQRVNVEEMSICTRPLYVIVLTPSDYSQDVDHFEYTPKPDFEGPFDVFNEVNEEALIRRFYDHIQVGAGECHRLFQWNRWRAVRNV